MINLLLFKITLLIYFAATAFYLVDVIARREQAGKIARWLLTGGFALHCAVLVARYFAVGHTPVTNLTKPSPFSPGPSSAFTFFSTCATA